jgi:hypothetical protein
MLRNSATCSFIVGLRKAVLLSQIFFPKLEFSRSFWKRGAAQLLWATFVTRRPCQVHTSRFQPVFWNDWFTDLDPALFFKSFQDVNVFFFPIAYLWYICISLHRRQIGILYLEVTRPKLTVLALIQMFNDDIHAGLLLLISSFLQFSTVYFTFMLLLIEGFM